MKKMKYVICWLLVIVALGTLCSCSKNAGNESQTQSVEEKVREAVEAQGILEFYGKSIGGKELKSSSATISTVKKISDTEYKVSGSMIMTDVYGTNWSNNFDCTVKSSDNGNTWDARSFKYTGDNWNKN